MACVRSAFACAIWIGLATAWCGTTLVAQTPPSKPVPLEQPAPPLTITVTAPPKSANELRQEAAERDRAIAAQASAVIANWVLVGIGVITAGVVGWQACETRRAAQASEKAAAAADVSGQAAKKAAEVAGQQLELAAATHLELKELRSGFTEDNGHVAMVTVGYTVANVSPNVARRVLLVKDFRIKGEELRYDDPVSIDALSPAKGFHTAVTVGPLTVHERESFALGRLKVEFHLEASWIDPLGRQSVRRFSRLVTLGPTGAESTYLSPDKTFAR